MANDLVNSAILDIPALFRIPTTIQNLWQQHCEQKTSENRDKFYCCGCHNNTSV